MTAAMERRINDFLAQRGCPARLIKEYGMSEVAGIVCVSYGNWEAGDVGRPLPGCRIIAVDPETGAVCPPEVQGELIIQSNTVMNGYYLSLIHIFLRELLDSFGKMMYNTSQQSARYRIGVGHGRTSRGDSGALYLQSAVAGMNPGPPEASCFVSCR